MTTKVLFLLLVVACKPSDKPESVDAQASPQASAQPAPLAPDPIDASVAVADSGPPPQPLRGDRALESDPQTRDPIVAYSLTAALRITDIPATPKGPEIITAAIEAARRKSARSLSIDVGASRLRLELGGGFVFSEKTELRARTDRWGHALVMPDGRTYHTLGPGALRAFFDERRLDTVPLTAAEIGFRGEVGRYAGQKTRRVEVTTRAAKTTFEIAKLEGLGDAGGLVARIILELAGAHPSTVVTQWDEVPLFAEIKWASHGGLVFEATQALKRTDLPWQQVATPPATASFVPSPPPREPGGTLLTVQEREALHASSPPIATLVLINGGDDVRFAYLDGAPLAWVAPQARFEVTGLQRGRYQIEWRTFLGDAADPQKSVSVPGTTDIGMVDASAP